MARAPIAQLHAAPAWRAVDLLSDLHLHPGDIATFDAWRGHLAAPGADALIHLGDLYDAWPGDDVADAPGFAADCAEVLRAAARNRPVWFMHGNRDFLVGQGLAESTGVRLLDDPTVLVFGGRRWLLSHGDALCLGDTEYLEFRAEVRTPAWREAFLERPLAERQAVAQALRARSEARKQSGAPYADVDTDEALSWLDAAGADVLVHGHTHRPGEHDLGGGRQRIVLSDWDLAARPPRAEVLRLEPAGPRRIALA